MINRYSLIIFATAATIGSVIMVPMQSLGFVLPKLPFLALAALSGLVFAYSNKINLFGGLLRSKAGLMAVLFLAITMLSAFWSIAPIISFIGASPRFEGALAYFIFFSAFLISYSLAKSNNLKPIYSIIIVSNSIIVFYGFLQMINLDPLQAFWKWELFLGRAFSTAGQPNFLGVFILLTLPFVFQINQRVRGKTKIIASSLLIMNLAVLAGTASRSSYLGIAVSGLLFVLISKPGRIKKSKIPSVILSLVITAMIILIAVSATGRRFSVHTQDIFLGSRSEIWKTSVRMILDRPQGYGLDAMGLASQKFVAPKFYEFESLATIIDRAHSKPLDLLVSTGPLGFIFYYLFLFYLLRSLWKKRDSKTAQACLLSLAGTSTALLFGFDTLITHFYFWLIVGISAGITSETTNKPSRSLSQLFLIAFMLFNLMVALLFMRWIYSRVLLEKSEHLSRGENAIESIKYAYKSFSAFPYDRASILSASEKVLADLESADSQNKDSLNIALSVLLTPSPPDKTE